MIDANDTNDADKVDELRRAVFELKKIATNNILRAANLYDKSENVAQIFLNEAAVMLVVASAVDDLHGEYQPDE